MLMRSAFWIGAPKAGREQHFREQIDLVMVPAMSSFPGVREVKALWPQAREADPPAIHCQLLVQFDDAGGLQRMLASDERKALRPRLLELVEAFDGHLAHIDYEVGAAG
jgi:antibiotic biosynthesis monooxygenase (ABM) superfamily enzyme